MASEGAGPGQGTQEHPELQVGVARVAVTDDPRAHPPAQPATEHHPVREEPMPKTGIAVAHPPHDELYDCTVIGAGPTGLYAAFYAGMREMSVKIIDSLGDLGGQVTALYPEKFIYDVAGFPAVKGKDLVAQCVQQGLQFGATVCLGERVETLERQPDGTFLLTGDKSTHRTRTVIISAGVGAFTPRKLPNAEELDALEGKSVFYFVRDPEQFRDKDVLIVGGGDSAMDWALNLEPVARSITLIHRRDRWRAHEDTVRKVLSSTVDVETFHEVRRVHAEDGTLSGVTIFDNRNGDERYVKVDRIVMCLGFIANIGPIRTWGLTIVDGGLAVDSTMATNVPGVFAAGDIARYTGKLNLIATGFGEAATAANHAKAFIDPHSRAFPGHSSERSDPHP
jgi:ferredoxin/flavodoxin---NADP+ reductase